MDINDVIAANIGLIYKQLHKLNIAYEDDAYAIGLEALGNAAATFNPAKGVKFATYASVCIYNCLCGYLRQQTKKRKLDIVLYDDPIPGAGSLTLYDTLGEAPSPSDEYLERELYGKLWEMFDKVLDTTLTDVEKEIILSWRQSDFTKTQVMLANETGVSQAHVSRTLSAFKHKLKKELEEYLC